MKRKFDDELILNDIKNGTKIKDILLKYGIKNRKTISDIKNRVGKEPNGRNSIKYYLNKIIEIHNFKYEYPYISTEFLNSKSKITIFCNECKSTFKQSISHHIWSKSGCRKCFGNSPNTIDEILNRSKEIHGDRYSYPNIKNEKVGSYDKITILCSKCNNLFKQSISSHLLHRNGCNRCVKSKSEKFIYNYLTSIGVEFISQHKFEGCKYKNVLYFDFFIPSLNLCIEYDGEQHFNPWRKISDGEERLKRQKIKDNIKNNFCLKNNINLIRISYKQNLEKELAKICFPTSVENPQSQNH